MVEALDLRNLVQIGHSTESGAVARYVAKHGPPCGAVLMSAVTLKAGTNPEGTPMGVFDGFHSALAANRAQFFRDVLAPSMA